MRGKEGDELGLGQTIRITPACAGKRIKLRKRHSICGEKALKHKEELYELGSPPRVRGKGVVDVLVPEPFGITPAHAGKRSGWPAVLSGPRDHPRVCGEKQLGVKECFR